jgi:hypothetical protein
MHFKTTQTLSIPADFTFVSKLQMITQQANISIFFLETNFKYICWFQYPFMF